MTDDDPRCSLLTVERLLAATPIGIALLDLDLRYLRVNDALAAINGRPAADHIGRAWRDISPETAETAEPILRGVVETGEPILDVELEAAVPGGARTRCFLVSYFALRSEEDGVSGLGATVLEITARKQVERAMREDIELREKVIAVVAHDLRGPLQTIQASGMLLGRQLAGAPHLQAHLDVIRRAVARMRGLVEDLLPLAR